MSVDEKGPKQRYSAVLRLGCWLNGGKCWRFVLRSLPGFGRGNTSLCDLNWYPAILNLQNASLWRQAHFLYVQFCSSFWLEEPLFSKHDNEYEDHFPRTVGRITIPSLSERFARSFICCLICINVAFNPGVSKLGAQPLILMYSWEQRSREWSSYKKENKEIARVRKCCRSWNGCVIEASTDLTFFIFFPSTNWKCVAKENQFWESLRLEGTSPGSHSPSLLWLFLNQL